jgi:hypothetical protein
MLICDVTYFETVFLNRRDLKAFLPRHYFFNFKNKGKTSKYQDKNSEKNCYRDLGLNFCFQPGLKVKNHCLRRLIVYLCAIDLNPQFLILLQLKQLAFGHRESVAKSK